MTENDKEIAEIDKFYKVKRVMQHKSMTSVFGRALEKAILEALFEIEREKSVLMTNVPVVGKPESDLATFRDFKQMSNIMLFKTNDGQHLDVEKDKTQGLLATTATQQNLKQNLSN